MKKKIAKSKKDKPIMCVFCGSRDRINGKRLKGGYFKNKFICDSCRIELSELFSFLGWTKESDKI
jgi:transposase-like protein